MQAEGGFNVETIEAITGIPTISTNTIASDTTFFNTLLAAY